MEVKIGVQHTPRELVIETAESADDVQAAVDKAFAEQGTLRISDTRGRVVVVAAAAIAYVEIGGGVSGQVGFRS
jgi:hypothetical protein